MISIFKSKKNEDKAKTIATLSKDELKNVVGGTDPLIDSTVIVMAESKRKGQMTQSDVINHY